MRKLLLPALLCCFVCPARADNANDMARLAEATLKTYHAADRATYLDNLFRMQFVAGRYADSARTIELMHEPVRNKQYGMLALALVRQRGAHVSFADAFAGQFRAMVRPMDDKTSALVLRLFNVSPTGGLSLLINQTALKRDLSTARRGHDTTAIIRAYQIEQSYRMIAPLVTALVAEEDARRYIVTRDIQVKTPDGAIVCALVVRPRDAKRRPTLMEFSIYADVMSATSEALRSASNGYAGVAGFSRGKLCSPGEAVPYEHDGADADTLIDWIARQPWSDGRVGLFGASYDGFTAWAALKHKPAAVKAIMTAVAAAPGIDVPTEGGVTLSFSYYWPFYVTGNKTLDGWAFDDHARWNKLDRDWYKSGRPYVDLEKFDRGPNPIWDRWIAHPDYDAYWQATIPYGREFAAIDIPVLMTTGYYDGGEIGALYYFAEHHRHRPDAEQYLVIGPYTHATGNRGTVDVLGETQRVLSGYTLDPAALQDFGALRYQWFDHIFKGTPKPTLLANKVNFEVMGANIWRHAPSLSAMAPEKITFHLDRNSLTDGPVKSHAIVQTIDLTDRSDADRVPVGGDTIDTKIDLWNCIEFVSKPFDKPVELDGAFAGRLEFEINKRDFDFAVQLYELTKDGKYVSLSWYITRASYARDRTHRHFFVPGVPQTIDFTATRLIARRFAAGSRLVAVIGLLRQPDEDINFGTGKPVRFESAADAGRPLSVRWSSSSTLTIPVRLSS